MNYPEYVKVDDKLYKINTDFRAAIKCNEIAQDNSINDIERALGIIYTLFGDDGINTPEHYEMLLKKAKKYLSCGEEIKTNEEEPDMDFLQDYGLIWVSMYSDYNGLDIDKEQIHWWKFMDLMNGLSNSEMGNCCALNRVRNLRNYDLKDIKDPKERKKIIDAKKQVALKKNKKKATKEELKSADEFLKNLGVI